MSRKVVAILLICGIMSNMLLILEISTPVKGVTTIYVDDDGGADYTTIQEALDAASPGDTVYVYEGTYYENIIINKTLNLTGEGMDKSIIEASGMVTVIDIMYNWVNVSGFYITSGHTGIMALSTSNIRISDNKISYNSFAIRLSFSENDTITNNVMVDNGIDIYGTKIEQWNTHNIDSTNTVNGKPVYYRKNQNGGVIPTDAGQVLLANCTGITVENLDISEATTGVSIGFSSGNDILFNSFSSNYFHGIYLTHSTNNNISGNIISNCDHSIYLHYSDNNFIFNNSIDGVTGSGVFVYYSNRNILDDNRILDINLGIGLSFSDDNKVRNNLISHLQWGIDVGKGKRNNLTGNIIISCSDYGMYISAMSLDNIIFHNDFIENSVQAEDYSNNESHWDAGYPEGGNYWSDYLGSDDFSGPNQDISGSDGIGDINYSITGGSCSDRYPLMAPMGWTPPPTLDYYEITDSPDGAEIDDVYLDVGEEIILYASGYNNSGEYTGPVLVEWSVSDESAGVFSILNGSSTTFTAGLDGISSLISSSNSTYGMGDSLALTIRPPTLDFIQIRNESSNEGIEVTEDEFTLGNRITNRYYCAGYNNTSGYIGEVSASWSVEGEIGMVDITSGTFTQFTATTPGIGTLTADHEGISNSISITVNPESDTIPPAAPTGLTISPGIEDGSLVLSWNSNIEPDLVGYYLYRSDSSTGPFVRIGSMITDTSYTDSGLSNGTYYYRLTALDDIPNESLDSTVVSGTINGSDNGTSDDAEPVDDGLPNDWEMEHFGDLKQRPFDDYDNDGFTNMEEYEAETDPSDDQDYPGGSEPKKEEGFLSSYWWMIVILILVVVVIIQAIVIFRRRGPGEGSLDEDTEKYDL